jgi:CheY-like chemotaxis protein
MPVTTPFPMQTKKKYRVLCVDDNEFGLYVNTVILRSEGYEVVSCSDAGNAATIANAEEIDLAVLDYDMPVMNGAELAALCKAANPEIKVILFSGSMEVPSWELALADLFVPKSEGIQTLLEGIEALLATTATSANVDAPAATSA